MSDPASGMAALNQRVARARRAAPPPRLPRPADSTPPEPEAPASNPNPAATGAHRCSTHLNGGQVIYRAVAATAVSRR